MTAAAETQAPLLSFVVPMRTSSELNAREHWATRHKRRARQRSVVALMMASGLTPAMREQGRWSVVLTRIAPRKLDGHDNLAASLKASVDAVAEVLGVDDGSETITWSYRQERGRPHEYAVRIDVW